MPGLIPHEAKESDGRRGLSQSERDCGVEKWWLFFVFLETDMEGIFRNLRGLDGKERKGSLGKWGLGKEVKVVVEEEEEEKRKIMESAVRKRSGKVVAGLGVMCNWCGGGGGGVGDMTIMMLVLCCGAQGNYQRLVFVRDWVFEIRSTARREKREGRREEGGGVCA